MERAIQRIKIFQILDCISHKYMSSATKIFQVCALLVNLQNPLIKKKEKIIKCSHLNFNYTTSYFLHILLFLCYIFICLVSHLKSILSSVTYNLLLHIFYADVECYLRGFFFPSAYTG